VRRKIIYNTIKKAILQLSIGGCWLARCWWMDGWIAEFLFYVLQSINIWYLWKRSYLVIVLFFDPWFFIIPCYSEPTVVQIQRVDWFWLCTIIRTQLRVSSFLMFHFSTVLDNVWSFHWRLPCNCIVYMSFILIVYKLKIELKRHLINDTRDLFNYYV
jgi:hypothetical protein